MANPAQPFSFEISLSTLNHLGRQLYRSFATVLGEAISNAWDADARNVRIYLDHDKKGFWIKDDGVGMTASDFQNKFLKIGYSKRRKGGSKSPTGRPYVGRKGIGKLALLSCAQRISILSKVKGGNYVGGTIDNSDLDAAIRDDLSAEQYALASVAEKQFGTFTRRHGHGTIIRFEGINDGVRRSFEFLRKTIALSFRFSLLDPNFNIFLNDTKITHKDLAVLIEKTEFLWKSSRFSDPFVRDLEKLFKEAPTSHESKRFSIKKARGFIASVKRPRDLKVLTTSERLGVDLFVNGRLRERDILRHIPTASVVESYLYGQLHYDDLDDKTDRFTSSREGIIADDPKFRSFLNELRKQVLKIVSDWDVLRRKHREEGDPENESISKAQRASGGLYNVVAKDFKPSGKSSSALRVDKWVDDLSADAEFNFEAYAECFLSENLIRKFIQDRSMPLSSEASAAIEKWKAVEKDHKNQGNVSIKLRRSSSPLQYLSMTDLANLVDKAKDKVKHAALSRDASEFTPMRNAVAHTALLTEAAKKRLVAVRENIRGRIKTLLSQPAPKPKGTARSKRSKTRSSK